MKERWRTYTQEKVEGMRRLSNGDAIPNEKEIYGTERKIENG